MPPDDAKRPASLQAAGAARSLRRGDAPEEVLSRYLTDTARGRTLDFYVDARAPRPAFRDRGDRLFIDRNDPQAIRAMIDIAQHRGWAAIRVTGDAAFRREAWTEGRRRGLEVRGYAPTPRDLQAELRQRRPDTPTRGGREDAGTAKPMPPERRAAIVEAVIAARMLDPDRARRLLDSARSRLAPLVKTMEQTRTR